MEGVFNIAEIEESMKKAISSLQKNLSGLRAGRASPDLLGPVMIDAYGGKTPLSQLSTITAPQPRTLSVQVWDASLIKQVEKAIIDSGMSASVDQNCVFVTLPPLTQERRQEMVKKAKEYAENARISVRNIRHEGQKQIQLAKDTGASEDECFRLQKDLQKRTDDFIKKIEDILVSKEKDISEV
ncbi:ribosome recycling factor [Candidatus Hydrogenosomobacter endosymbioticus]|uniref:Ribosome-recycling factor n=1 Tax=Candidatus Hydrogenosomobacter endosymbioticus TaxID=2558174 RepID=A0ABM7V997_9PROT|nr:ribosome recycling factor [Candidatus Hydrogenosomobacter endosymbioticus]BDB96358.1 ribosome-recycling factor [Candidatus Hydrogenosomobacter endosymbioticus]